MKEVIEHLGSSAPLAWSSPHRGLGGKGGASQSADEVGQFQPSDQPEHRSLEAWRRGRQAENIHYIVHIHCVLRRNLSLPIENSEMIKCNLNTLLRTQTSNQEIHRLLPSSPPSNTHRSSTDGFCLKAQST